MAREIKFRAWDKHEEIMIYSEQTDYPFDWGLGFYGIEVQECDGSNWNTMKDLEFMQYTGLKDKQGVEIYEGDICRCLNAYGEDYYISSIIDNGWAFCVDVWGCDYDYTVLGLALEHNDINEIEVIGNIYENKELLQN